MPRESSKTGIRPTDKEMIRKITSICEINDKASSETKKR